ncbi:hypothetical protein PoB_003314500 [Plakobranchus ocellatus]|uniref:Uncharacterized protein n=1 Tax=Plakobranchus ocellatus TaxID=259542 RepID=A0AAV4AEN4_9GAST|nr:hypothetical protein PoB_003314500 [Plakobranchus ocellatus]
MNHHVNQLNNSKYISTCINSSRDNINSRNNHSNTNKNEDSKTPTTTMPPPLPPLKTTTTVTGTVCQVMSLEPLTEGSFRFRGRTPSTSAIRWRFVIRPILIMVDYEQELNTESSDQTEDL